MKKKWLNVTDIDVKGKKVLVRGDLDVEDGENPRVESVRQLVTWLLGKRAAKIKVIGHRETDFDICSQFSREFPGVEFDDKLREDAGEKLNDIEYAKRLAEGFEVYINEAFATSHRKHCSLVALPQFMRGEGKSVGLGLRFVREIEMLSAVWDKPGKRILVIGGIKVEDKQKFAESMKDKFTAILKGGLLPGVALRPDGLDISDKAIEEYKEVIATAEVILAAGVMGKYEDENAAKGTREILTAISRANAYKVAGGGDIETAISTYDLSDKFDWISVGGGAMLQFLGTGTLAGLDAVVD